jgi:hypothetical protein
MVRVIRTTRQTPATTVAPQQADTKLLIDFISASLTSTGQDEYYNTKEEQRKSLLQTHKPILEKYREFYALLLVSTINDINKQIIVMNLLKNGRDVEATTKEYENNLILQSLSNMQTNRAYATFELLAENKVNNTRSRELARKFLESRKNYKYEFVKYKSKVKKIVTHNHLYKKNEIWDFLFDKKKTFTDPLLNDYVKAKTDIKAAYRLPYSIAEGFAAYHKVDRAEFLSKIKDKMTDSEKQRLTTSAKAVGVNVAADWTHGDLRKILIYLYSLDRTPANMKEIIETKAKKEASLIPYKYDKVVVIVDNSASSYGSEEKKFHPVASELANAFILEQLSRYFTLLYTNPVGNRIIPQVGGESNLAVPLIKALAQKPDVVFILSDGYENVVAGAVAQVINAYKRQLDKDNKTMIIQLSSVFAAESHSIRQLTELVPNVGIRDTSQLFGALLLSTMAFKKEQTLLQFVNYLKAKVKTIEYKNYLLEA